MSINKILGTILCLLGSLIATDYSSGLVILGGGISLMISTDLIDAVEIKYEVLKYPQNFMDRVVEEELEQNDLKKKILEGANE